MRAYFSEYDGKAITVYDLLAIFEKECNVDLKQFAFWYQKAGTPIVKIESDYDEESEQYSLTFSQTLNGEPSNMVIPIKLGIVSCDGSDIPLKVLGENNLIGTNGDVFVLDSESKEISFGNVKGRPIPSFLRDFSAPVKIDYEYSIDFLAWLMLNDNNLVNRWRMSRDFYQKLIFDAAKQFGSTENRDSFDEELLQNCLTLLDDEKLDLALKALLLELPTERELVQNCNGCDVDALCSQREYLEKRLAKFGEDKFKKLYQELDGNVNYVFNYEQFGRRKLRNLSLNYLVALENDSGNKLAHKQYEAANNITDKLAALTPIVINESKERSKLLQNFYINYQDEPFLIDRWFMLQAEAKFPTVLDEIKKLMQHEKFSLEDSNRVRALVRHFTSDNIRYFHAKDGSGYKFLTETVLAVDKINPQLAARLVNPLLYWRDFDELRQKLIKQNLELIAQNKLSKNLHEVVKKALL